MKGCLILADGTRMDGTLAACSKTAFGWLAANTAVVGFQEMITDPAYKGRILAFTYPEVGNVGVNPGSSESPAVQVTGLVVKVLSGFYSHYLATGSLESLLSAQAVPCLTGIDTRELAIHLRDKGEMPAAIAPADADLGSLLSKLASAERLPFSPTEPMSPASKNVSGAAVAVLNLGIRTSELQQLNACCRTVLFPHNAKPAAILASRPAGVIVSDGPGASLPPSETVQTIQALLGRAPILACGLGQVALGMALGCKPAFLKRGHHGANYPIKNVLDGKLVVADQRHTIVLDRTSVKSSSKVELLWENLNDQTVEGIRTRDGSAVGLQSVLSAPQPGMVNPHIKAFVEGLQ
jgi:carbamoyl-phosphate synthase small subunit